MVAPAVEAAPGDTVVFEFETYARHVSRATLVDANGSPLEGVHVVAGRPGSIPKRGRFHAVSDGQGTVTFPAPPSWLCSPSGTHWVGEHQGQTVVGTAKHPANLRASLTPVDLGSIVMGRSVVLASGRIVDDEGRPLVRTRLTAKPVASRGAVGCECTTDAQGRFEFLGPGEGADAYPQGTSIVVQVHREDYRSHVNYGPLRLGTTRAELTAGRPGHMEFTLDDALDLDGGAPSGVCSTPRISRLRTRRGSGVAPSPSAACRLGRTR